MRQTQHQGRTAYVLGEASDPESVASTPGIYVAPSSSPSYGVLRGLVLGGYATELGETQTEDGELAVAVEVTGGREYRPNASALPKEYWGQEARVMKIGDEWFTKSKAEYANWREAHVREAVQNAVDAHSTRVDITLQPLDANMNELPLDAAEFDFLRVSYEDDGDGMDLQTLEDKFLTFGGTGKGYHGEFTGGFGKAKELLLFPWVSWGLHTRDNLVVDAHGNQFTIAKTRTRKGTALQVIMRGDECISPAVAISMIRKCYAPNVRFSVNGKTVKADLQVGEQVRRLAGLGSAYAIVYYDKKKRLDGSQLLVRINGLYMFGERIDDKVGGTVIVELVGSTRELVTVNRDGLRDWKLREELSKLIAHLSKNPKSALSEEGSRTFETYEGERFYAKMEEQKRKQSEIASRAIVRVRDVDTKEISGDDLLGIIEALSETDSIAESEPEAEEREDRVNLALPPGAAEAMLNVPFRGAHHVEEAVKALAWTPAFAIMKHEPWFKVPRRFTRENMSPTSRKLCMLWALFCRFVMMQLGCSKPYGVGWVFSPKTAGMYARNEGGDWLLLNPLKLTSGGMVDEDGFSLGNQESVNIIYAIAVHECTHMADGELDHDEGFSTALTYNIAKTANRGTEVNKIRKAVVARSKRAGATAGGEEPRTLPGKPARAAKVPKARVPEAMRDDAVSALLTEWGVMGDQSYLLERMKDAAEGDWFEAYSAFGTIFNSVSTLIRAFVAYDNETVVWGPLSPYSDPSLRDFVSSHRPCSIILSQIVYASEAHDRAPGPGLVFDGHRWYVTPSASEWLLERGA